MSYRLIDANALAWKYKEINDMPCIYADLPNGLDDGYYDLEQGNADKSRWHELFGTPERAARTLHQFCADCFCGDCATCGVPEWANYSHDYNTLLEWLRGDEE